VIPVKNYGQKSESEDVEEKDVEKVNFDHSIFVLKPEQ
jgi:hypothetical protein